jgi:rod shape determining protein RodA
LSCNNNRNLFSGKTAVFDRRLVINFDVSLFLAVLCVIALGVVNLNSISAAAGINPMFHQKQIYWALISLGAFFIIINFNYLIIIRNAYYLHCFSLLLLFLVLFFGKTVFGSQRWLFFAGITIQPSELAKITFVLALAKFFSENISIKPYTLRDFFFPLLLLACTAGLIFLQPDLGTAGLFLLIFFSFFPFLNIKRNSVFSAFAFFVVSLPGVWLFLKDYQKKRIFTFFNPELDPLNAGYQIIQSKIAVGSGSLFGKGYQAGTQSQLRFLPEQHTDFVFSVWAEEWGFAGCMILLFLFFFIFYRGLSIAFTCKNFYGSFAAIGITFLLFFQFTINVFMTLGFFPVVGIPLPFFSYGGSSLLASVTGIAFLINIQMRKFK